MMKQSHDSHMITYDESPPKRSCVLGNWLLGASVGVVCPSPSPLTSSFCPEALPLSSAIQNNIHYLEVEGGGIIPPLSLEDDDP